MADTERLYSTLISMLSDGAAAHSTNRQLIRDLLKSVHLYPTLGTETGVVSERFPYGDVRRYGADPTGGADSTSAFAALALLGGTITVPKGTYKLTDEVLFQLPRTNIRGDGQQSSIIKFAPSTTGKAAFHFKLSTAFSIPQCSVRGLGFDATGNDQGSKTAIRITDGEEIIIDDFAVSNWTSSATRDCIGLQIRGRQTIAPSNYVIVADLPISIEDNPNSFIDIDHSHFRNGYTIAHSSQPHVKIASGVQLSDVTFDGYQAWAVGSDGLVWVDTTSSGNSQNLTLKNVRWEQSTNATGYMIRIEHNSQLNGLILDNVSGGLSTLGIKLRNVAIASLRTTKTLNTSGNSLDVDSTVQPLILDNCFFQTGGTVSTGTLKKVYESGSSVLGGATKPYVVYALPATIVAAHTEIPLMGPPVVIAQDATASLGKADDTCGYVDIVTSENVIARFVLTGTTHSTGERDDFAGFFSVTKDTAASYNVYYNAASGNYLIQNKRTGSKTVRWLIHGDKV